MKSREQELEEALAWAQKRIETQAAEIRRLHARARDAELALDEATKRLVILDGADKRLEAMERADERARSPRVPVEGPMADMRRDLDRLTARVADLEVAVAGDGLFPGAADRVRRRARGAKEDINHG